MGRSESRVAARRAVQEAQAERRRQRATQDKQLQALAIDVQVILLDAKKALLVAEIAAGKKLTEMIEELGATSKDAVEWCCGAVTVTDVARLRAAAREENDVPR